MVPKQSPTYQPSPEYVSWKAMHNRCNRPTEQNFKWYGGSEPTIKVCKRWHSYRDFKTDMGERPPGTVLLRRNTRGNYSPSNCFWGTLKEQGKNRRNNHRLNVDGQSLTITEWAERTNQSHTKITKRLERGWSPREAVYGRPRSKPPGSDNPSANTNPSRKS